jgi:hypothetical protein
VSQLVGLKAEPYLPRRELQVEEKSMTIVSTLLEIYSFNDFLEEFVEELNQFLTELRNGMSIDTTPIASGKSLPEPFVLKLFFNYLLAT